MKNTQTLPILVLIFSLFACNSQEVREENFENGNPKLKFQVVENDEGNFIKNGYYKEWYQSGQLRINATYLNGQPNDSWVENFENGNKMEEGKYVNGKKEGLWTIWHENGQMSKKTNYTNGMVDGKENVWYSNGQISEENHYLKGKKHGICTKWLEDGSKIKEETYDYGKNISLVGKWKNNQGFILTYYTDGLVFMTGNNGAQHQLRYTFENDVLSMNGYKHDMVKITKNEYVCISQNGVTYKALKVD